MSAAAVAQPVPVPPAPEGETTTELVASIAFDPKNTPDPGLAVPAAEAGTAPSAAAAALAVPSNVTPASKSKSASKKRADKGKKGQAAPAARKGGNGQAKITKIPHGMVLDKSGRLVPVQEYTLGVALDSANASLEEFRGRMQHLVGANAALQAQCEEQERDALAVISALNAENEAKAADMKVVREEYEERLRHAERERTQLVEKYESKLADMLENMAEKEVAYKEIQQEVAVIKDFRRKRSELMKELEASRAELRETEQKNKDVVTRMERKFFEEKLRLQREANRKLEELASKAHQQAIVNLQDTTKEVYKENIRMADALKHYVKESQDLNKLNAHLTLVNKDLVGEKELHNTIVREKIVENRTQRTEIKDLQLKIRNMEYALSHVVREFEYERDLIGQRTRQELDQVRDLAVKLKDRLKRKTSEMKHIKFLAQHILNQRTDLERFFMDALDAVRREMHKEREASRRKAQDEYNRRMKLALGSKEPIQFPAIRSFRIPPPVSKSGPGAAATILAPNAHPSRDDLTLAPAGVAAFPRAPSPPPDPRAKLDISEITWRDKERVLRLLFAQMNGLMIVQDDPRVKPEPLGGGLPLAHSPGARKGVGAKGLARGKDEDEDEENEDVDSDVESLDALTREQVEDGAEEGKTGVEDPTQGSPTPQPVAPPSQPASKPTSASSRW